MSKDRYDLNGKVAIVIGATKGMGETISHQFAESGAKVLVSSRTASEADELASTLNDRYGRGNVVAVGKAGDMTSRSDLTAIVDCAVEAFGKLTTLVISPAIEPWFGSSIDIPDEELDKLYLYIFKSKYIATSLCIPHIAKAGGGAVVYIGSGSAFEGTSERAATSCMRAAEAQLIKNFASEFGQNNIRFNIISPGLIDAHGSKKLFENKAAVEEIVSKLPMRRYGTTEEISSVVTFLVSEASSFVTGAVVPVDGGRLLHAAPNRLKNVFAPDED